MQKIYTILLYLCAPFIFIYLYIHTRKTQDYKSRWAELCGKVPHPIKPGGIWLHAVSLGELSAALPLIKALKRDYPDSALTVTTMTKSAANRLQAELGENVYHVYVPLDFPCATRRFLDAVKPRLAIFMETELWPNRIAACVTRKIPVLLASARLSPPAFKSNLRAKWLFEPTLANITRVIAQTEADASRYQQLGMPASRITVAGNIKFDLEIPAAIQTNAQELRNNWQTRPVWIAASTHEGEETQVLQAFKKIQQHIPNVLLILVPRHPTRFNAVKTLCVEQGYKVALRTVGESDYSDIEIFIGNTTGELLLFYAASDVAFVGGSLVPVGGHNLLEPASLGLPLLIGPHTFNCEDICALLTDAKGLIRVTSAEQMAAEVIKIFSDADLLQRLGVNAKKVVEENRGALARHLEIIAQFTK